VATRRSPNETLQSPDSGSDGTTIASRGDSWPSAAVEQAVKAAHPLIKVAVATGRTWSNAEAVIHQLGITEPCILDGGSRIILPTTGQIIFDRPLSVAKQQEVLAICLPLQYSIFASVNNQSTLVTNLEDATEPAGKIEIENVPRPAVEAILQKLAAIDDISIHLASSWQAGAAIQITDPGATKEHAVAELLKIMDIAPLEAIGVGDHFNDLPLFKVVGLKVAMGNAPPELKAAADYIAPDLEHDGVADVIQKFIL
jgi:Cof subfamily protein (haloacid dehalogenase superfamily)